MANDHFQVALDLANFPQNNGKIDPQTTIIISCLLKTYRYKFLLP